MNKVTEIFKIEIFKNRLVMYSKNKESKKLTYYPLLQNFKKTVDFSISQLDNL